MMLSDFENTLKLLDLMVVEDLDGRFEAAVEAAEIPFKANITALKLLDIKEDVENGVDAVDILIEGMDLWVEQLEGLRDAAQKVAKQAASALR